ncbi:MAG: hypothetical protein ABIA63_12585, partial [bacterium]
ERISTSKTGSWNQLKEFIYRNLVFYSKVKKFKPHVLTGIMGPTIATMGWILQCPRIVFYDTECATFTNRFVYPLASAVVTPDCYKGRVGKNHVAYSGYHELAYLHPNYFKPDINKIRNMGLEPENGYCVVRFVGWWATHDRGESGLSTGQKMDLVKRISEYTRVIISSEAPLPQELIKYKYMGELQDIHHLLAYANMFYGESATMASESAVLGTPAIYIAETGRGYTDDQEKRYGLVCSFKKYQFEDSVKKAIEIITGPKSKIEAVSSRKRLLNDKSDVTAFMIDFFENKVRRG